MTQAPPERRGLALLSRNLDTPARALRVRTAARARLHDGDFAAPGSDPEARP